jgi:O-antigen ligase/polysaccharide polymerase Wzy-like membrane protein
MSSVPKSCDRLVKWGLVALIAFTPFAFGTVEPWSIAFMEWGVVTLLLVYVLGRLWPSADARSVGYRLTGLEFPVGLFLLICVLQTVPLPIGWLSRISPGSARMYQRVDLSTWAETGQPARLPPADADPLLRLELPDRRPVSVDPGQTWRRIRLVASLAAVFFLVGAWAMRNDRILFIVRAVTVVGFLVAVLGLVQYLTWNGKIFWIRRIPSRSAFGPFVNHNHFAGYVEMVIPVAISLVFYLVEIPRRERRTSGSDLDRWNAGHFGRDRADEGGRWGKSGLALFASVILVVSLFFCLSRGGILSTLASGLILFALMWRRVASRALAWTVALVIPGLVAAFIIWIGADVVKRQLGTYKTVENEASFRLRVRIWDAMLREMPNFLWTGSGLGTFEESFAPYTPPGSSNRWDKAHNDYLQILWETGILGTGLFALGAGIFARRYWWPAVRSREHPLDLFRLGIAVSLLSIALHSVVDFNLQIGANGFLCSLLAGLLTSLHRTIEGEPTERPGLIGASRRAS